MITRRLVITTLSTYSRLTSSHDLVVTDPQIAFDEEAIILRI
jgi:hypothetical protein